MFKNFKLGTKLTGGYLIVASLIVIVALLGYTNMKNINDGMTSMYKDRLLPIEQLGKANSSLYKVRGDLYKFIAIPNERDKASKELDQAISEVEKQLKLYEDSYLNQEEKENLAKFKAAWGKYQEALKESQKKINADDMKTVFESLMTGTLHQTRKEIDDALTALIEINANEADKLNKAGDATFASSSKWMFGGTILGLALAVGLGLLISRGISRRVGQAATSAEALRKVCISSLGKASLGLAQGQLDVSVDTNVSPLEITSNDEIDHLAKSLNGIIEEAKTTASSFTQATGTLREVIAQTDTMIKNAQDGELQMRGDDGKYEGAYRAMVQGVNAVMDAVATPLKEASDVLQQMAGRELNVRMEGSYKGEYAKIKQSLNVAAQNLDEALTQVALGAEQVTSAAAQISTGSQELSHSASEQAATLEETSSSLQELSSMASQNAANAREAKGLTEAATASTEQGVQVMQELNGSIVKIKASSDATAKIVKTIDEIAFQTNLLALNAAVEAARAGDAGKGFAVVAEEVRNLAIRSAEAAKNTANLIEESVKNAEDGVRTNQKMLAGLTEITSQVKKVSEVMAEIAVASDQQKDGVNQINKAIEQMNQVTQVVAANAEESASAAEELSGQSTEMMSMVESFKLSAGASIKRTRSSASVKSHKSSMSQATLGQKQKSNGNEHGPKALIAERVIPFHEAEESTVMTEF